MKTTQKGIELNYFKFLKETKQFCKETRDTMLSDVHRVTTRRKYEICWSMKFRRYVKFFEL